MRFLKTENLNNAFSEVFRLAKLISTIPATTVSVERSFSALKRIQTYKRSKQGEEGMSNLAILSIEKQVLETKKTFRPCHPEVFQKTRGVEFMYK